MQAAKEFAHVVLLLELYQDGKFVTSAHNNSTKESTTLYGMLGGWYENGNTQIG
jgi:hypothetical protein